MCGLSKNIIYTTTQRATKNISAHVSHETISIQHRFPIFQTFFNQRNLKNYTIPCFDWFLLHQPIHHPLRSHITENPPADWLATQQLHWDLHDKKTSHWPMPLALLGFSIPAPLLASFRLPNPWTSSFLFFLAIFWYILGLRTTISFQGYPSRWAVFNATSCNCLLFLHVFRMVKAPNPTLKNEVWTLRLITDS